MPAILKIFPRLSQPPSKGFTDCCSNPQFLECFPDCLKDSQNVPEKDCPTDPKIIFQVFPATFNVSKLLQQSAFLGIFSRLSQQFSKKSRLSLCFSKYFPDCGSNPHSWNIFQIMPAIFQIFSRLSQRSSFLGRDKAKAGEKLMKRALASEGLSM